MSVDSLILWQLPKYKNEHVLRDKLLQAIYSDTGHLRSFTTELGQDIL